MRPIPLKYFILLFSVRIVNPGARFTKGLKSQIRDFCLKSKIYPRFFSDLRSIAQLGFTKDLRLRFASDLVSNLRLPKG